ncbi:GSCOCG00003752001-RA-CDS, partial [Cotesia congregata]
NEFQKRCAFNYVNVGVRLNERRSQTRLAQTKFNYRTLGKVLNQV